MTKLNDTMRILLASAAQRDDSSVLPLPASLTASASVTKAMASMLTAGLAAERETSAGEAIHRTDGDLRYGLYATPAGLAAIGIGDDATDSDDRQPPVATASPSSKKAAVLALLGGDSGATTAELITATGWLPHTTRAALTGLRKAGHTIERSKRDGDTCYRLVASA